MTSPWYLLEGKQDCSVLLCLMEAFELNSAKQAFTSSKERWITKLVSSKGINAIKQPATAFRLGKSGKMNAVCEGTSQLFGERHFVGSRQWV